MQKYKLIAMTSVMAVMGLTACSNNKVVGSDDSQAKRIAELEAKLNKNDRVIDRLQSENADLRGAASSSHMAPVSSAAGALYPPNAKAGECYARVLKPATYKQVSKQVVKQTASERIEIIPAEYTMVEQKVLVKEASEVISTVPAQFKWVEETYVVEPEKTELVTYPATYKTLSEKVLVKPAYTTWKKGRGPIEKINDSTGEIMCLVEVPAEYRTITKKVLDQPAYTKPKVTPAKYGKVKKKVLVKEAQVVKDVIPAEYKTIKVRKMVTPARENKIKIPAEYGTITERQLVTKASLQWQPILCETNTTPKVIHNIQAALNKAGYDAGTVDGVLGQQTMAALKKFQIDNGLASGNITMESLKKLGVY